MKNIKLIQKFVGIVWLLVYILISVKYLKSAAYPGSWGTTDNLLYLDTSSIPMLGRFFPSLVSYLPKIEVFKELFCIISSLLLILNTKNSRKIFIFLMAYNIVDALISCYIIKLEMKFLFSELFLRTLWAEYILIFLSLFTSIFLAYSEKNSADS